MADGEAGPGRLKSCGGGWDEFWLHPETFMRFVPHLLLSFLVQSQPFSFPHPSWNHLPAHTAYDSLEAGGRTDGCLCSFQTAGNKCELLARTQLSQGLRPSGEGAGWHRSGLREWNNTAYVTGAANTGLPPQQLTSCTQNSWGQPIYTVL